MITNKYENKQKDPSTKQLEKNSLVRMATSASEVSLLKVLLYKLLINFEFSPCASFSMHCEYKYHMIFEIK